MADDRALALDLADVGERLGPAVALDGASLRVRPATVHALLGENGAGKSTLMRVAFGVLRPDRGTITVAGTPRRFGSSADAIAAGLGMVHQHFSLVPAMTVAENVALGGRGAYSRRRVEALVRRLGEETGLVVDAGARAGSLGVGAQQRVEIVNMLSRDARVLILDEPTAVLAPQEAADLLAWLRRFADGGRSVVLITHKLREVLAVADDVTVLRRGRTVTAVASAVATEASLATAMLGAPPRRQDALELGVDQHLPAASASDRLRPSERGAPAPPLTGAAGSESRGPKGKAVMRARGLTLATADGVVRVRGATFEVRAGEIVGVAAVEGSGQRELLRALAGRLTPSGGTVELPSEVGFVPEDRHHDALVLDFPLTANVALRGAGARRGMMRWSQWRSETRRLLRAFDVRSDSGEVPARTLSGGNQQKLVLGRELGTSAARAIVVENPTRGLDIRATGEVHERLREAAGAGAAVVVYSSDLDEVLLLAHRVLVLHAGVVVEPPCDRAAIGRAMLGGG